MTAETSRPRPDELEVSLFGAGNGECVVAHCGNDDWVIVDSFRDLKFVDLYRSST